MRQRISALLILLSLFNSLAFAATNQADIEKINQSFSELCQQQKFSGAALVAINGKPVFKRACGWANRSFAVANTVDTKFNLGSVAKLFTIVSILQLVQADKLSLQTPAFTIVPAWLKMKAGHQITIEQLLTHRSGLGDFMQNKKWQQLADDGVYIKTDDYQSLIANQPLLFLPGNSQRYSNSAYIVLGKVIEQLMLRSKH